MPRSPRPRWDCAQGTYLAIQGSCPRMSPLPPRARDTLGCAHGMRREGVDLRVATCMSRRQPTGRLVVWPLRVCAPVYLVCLKMPGGFSPLSHEQKGEDGHELCWPLVRLPGFPVRDCATPAPLVIEQGGFSWRNPGNGKDGDPQGLRSAGGTRKGAIISGVLLAGMQHSHVGAVLETRCRSFCFPERQLE